jgi:hypothetical protein
MRRSPSGRGSRPPHAEPTPAEQLKVPVPGRKTARHLGRTSCPESDMRAMAFTPSGQSPPRAPCSRRVGGSPPRR